MADQSNVMWRAWRGFILKGTDKFTDKKAVLECRRKFQGIEITGTVSKFYRKED